MEVRLRRFTTLFLMWLMRLALSVRYRVKVEGLENVNTKTMHKPGGILFLPNHPTVFVDPTLAVVYTWKRFSVRPLIVEYMFYTPVVNKIMSFLKAVPIPNFVVASNSLKKKKSDEVIQTVICGLKNRENFLIYPAGKVKHQAKEIVNGSAVHQILQECPETNVVLVRIKGLWGSKFSRALTGKTPWMFETIFWGIKEAFKSLIFFLPKRDVTLEFVPAPANFPFNGSRLEVNRFLENWYNQMEADQHQLEGEPLDLVSYSAWKNKIIKPVDIKKDEQFVDLKSIDEATKEEIKQKIAKIANMDVNSIDPEMSLGADLGLDSLDSAEIVSFLDDQFEISSVPVSELTTVKKVMAIADNKIEVEAESDDSLKPKMKKWQKERPQILPEIPAEKRLDVAFLKTCDRLKSLAACADDRAGVLTYSQVKMRVLLLAEHFKTLPCKYVGVLLPSSVAAYLTVLALQVAGKVPLMINWTVGPRHFESVVKLTDLKTVISSWAFIDRLENVDFGLLEDKIEMLEDISMKHFGLGAKLKALYRSRLKADTLAKLFEIDTENDQAEAVLLFTSGTESTPKGVPLTHQNILSNQKACLKIVKPQPNECMMGILPPFHSFGFTLSGLLPLVSGFKVAYFPDPTDGKAVAGAINQWQATLLCGAPSFLKSIFKNGKNGLLKSLRICFTGAEKPSPDLRELCQKNSGCTLSEGYGITECSPVITLNLAGEMSSGVGAALPGLEILIVDLESHQPQVKGKEGLVLVRGPSIFNGYLNKDVASPFMEVDGHQWYCTGDLGHLNQNNELILSGRLKRFVKIGGEMISLAAIEHALHSALKDHLSSGDEEGPEMAVCAVEQAGEKTKIYLFVKFNILVEEVNSALKQAGFSNLTKIQKVIKIDQIPIMGSGKINYRALEAELPKFNKE